MLIAECLILTSVYPKIEATRLPKFPFTIFSSQNFLIAKRSVYQEGSSWVGAKRIFMYVPKCHFEWMLHVEGFRLIALQLCFCLDKGIITYAECTLFSPSSLLIAVVSFNTEYLYMYMRFCTSRQKYQTTPLEHDTPTRSAVYIASQFPRS